MDLSIISENLITKLEKKYFKKSAHAKRTRIGDDSFDILINVDNIPSYDSRRQFYTTLYGFESFKLVEERIREYDLIEIDTKVLHYSVQITYNLAKSYGVVIGSKRTKEVLFSSRFHDEKYPSQRKNTPQKRIDPHKS